MNLKLYLKILFNTIKKRKFKELRNLVLLWLDQIREPDYVRGEIIFTQIEPTRRCNLKCLFCDHALEKQKEEELSLDRFKTILGKLPYLQKVSLVGVGEPLLNNSLFEMLTFAKSKNIKIGFTTNGTLLNDKIVKNIIHSGLDWINISLDGTTKETFENIRNGANFENIVENIRRLVQVVGRKSKPEISIWFLAVKKNVHELINLVLLAKDIGIKKINVQIAHSWGKDIWKDVIDSEGIIHNLSNFKLFFLKAKSIAKLNGIILEYINMPDFNSKRRCKWPWRACYITADGFVTPCCLHGTDPEILNFGNIFKEDFITIWNNIGYQKFRKIVKSNKPPNICLRCPGYYGKIKI